jgi:hypothetical protein
LPISPKCADIFGSSQRLDQIVLMLSRERDLVMAMIVPRVLHPGSNLATARSLRIETCTTSLNSEMGLGEINGRELYKALDWLQERQPKVEKQRLKAWRCAVSAWCVPIRS